MTKDGETLTLERIGQFNVTDRPFTVTPGSQLYDYESISEIFQLDENWTDSLPRDAIILIIGGGIHRLTERELLKKRSDLRIITVDPTLGIEVKDEDNLWKLYINKGADYVIYSTSPETPRESLSMVPDGSTFQRNRINKVAELPGSVAALAPHLPFRNDSFDVVIDTFGPTRYLQSEDDLNKHLTQFCSFLKKGGIGYVNFVKPNQLELLQSVEDVNIEIIEHEELRLNGEGTCIHKIKISKK